MARKPLRSTAARAAMTGKDDTLDLTTLPPVETIMSLPENASSVRNLDFAKHYGKGCDVVVYAAQRTLQRMVRASTESGGKTLSLATIANYYASGLAAFLPFCTTMGAALGRDLRLADIDRRFVEHFIAHLGQIGTKLNGQKSRYSLLKSVLVSMGQSGWIAKDIFPRNPFPNSNRSLKGQTGLSEPERRLVLQALKSELRAIFKGSAPLTGYELSVCLLAIAVRTGINPTPALELLTDCLQPHPIKAGRYILVSFKRRGGNTHIQSLRRSADIESMVTALPDVARIINLVCSRNAEVRQASAYPQFLFVYEARRGSTMNKAVRLNLRSLHNCTQKFVERRDLTDSDGKPLKLNLMRLRKTFENRLYALSGQDPFLTAKLGGHSLEVSNNHYLEAPDSAEWDWRLMGEVRVEELMSHGKVSPMATQNTPVARCLDTLSGEFAPKNGQHCQKFLTCFRCHSFVVTGDDLYRVFSLYWMLVHMRQRMPANAWKRVYGHIIRIIDREIAPKFDAKMVAIQRERAKIDPHPFWRDAEILEGAA